VRKHAGAWYGKSPLIDLLIELKNTLGSVCRAWSEGVYSRFLRLLARLGMTPEKTAK